MQRETADLAGIAFGRAVIGGDRLQRRDLAPCVLAGGDAVGDRTHPQRVQAVVAACAVGQEGGFVLAFEPAFANQMAAHTVRDLAGQLRQLRGRRRAGAMQARFALWLLDVLVHAIKLLEGATQAVELACLPVAATIDAAFNLAGSAQRVVAAAARQRTRAGHRYRGRRADAIGGGIELAWWGGTAARGTCVLRSATATASCAGVSVV